MGQNQVVTFLGGQDPLLADLTVAGTAAPDAAVWQAWLADPDTRRRFEALTYRRGAGQCAYWLGAISSTGHGKFRAGSRARGSATDSRIVSAHVYAYQAEHGLIPDVVANKTVIRHRCDETSCVNGQHLIPGTQPENVGDYHARRLTPGPLADRRGARSRAIAIRDAIKAALHDGADPEEALATAIADGASGHQDPLF